MIFEDATRGDREDIQSTTSTSTDKKVRQACTRETTSRLYSNGARPLSCSLFLNQNPRNFAEWELHGQIYHVDKKTRGHKLFFLLRFFFFEA